MTRWLCTHLRPTLAVLVAPWVLAPAARAADCLALGLAPATGSVLQIREAGQDARAAMTFRDAAGTAWFVPLQSTQIGTDSRRQACIHEQLGYWRVPTTDTALRLDADTDTLTYLDLSQATQVIDRRAGNPVSTATSLDSLGVNYQIAASYIGDALTSRIIPSATGEFFAYRRGWYFNTRLAWSQNTRVSRYESYALKESPETGSFLRLGDAVSSPTAQGESLQFAGLSWGTDRTLRPSDFAPVLPTLRNGNALAGPLEVFINDNLQFQQTVQNGVVDLRNLPAQQGFNSYRVRTLDAQGNPVSVLREIYLPATLLPPGITAWRLDAGFQREDFFTRNAHYGAPLAVGSYSTGWSHDLTLGGQGLITRKASSMSLEADQRLSTLWTGHIGVQWARNTDDDPARRAPGSQQGRAVQLRLDGGGRFWRLLAEGTHAFEGLPSLGNRAALLRQRLLRAQWSGLEGWSLGLAHVRSQRELTAAQVVSTVSASTRVADSGASLSLAVTHTQAQGGAQTNLLVALFFPLSTPQVSATAARNQSVYLSQNAVNGAQLSRAQFSSSGQRAEDGVWGVGLTRDSEQTFSALDGAWSGSTRLLDLTGSARLGQNDRSALMSLRSSLLWTAGQMFATRPINGAFAMVSTGEPGVSILYENRPAGQTDAAGLLLVPGLLAQQTNRLSVDPSTWPIHWLASQVERQVTPPRGGGVLVSFKINAMAWASQPMVIPLSPSGKPYPAGTVATALSSSPRERAEVPADTVVDSRGQLWTGELLSVDDAVTRFFITPITANGQAGPRCSYTLPPPDSSTEPLAAPREPVKLPPDGCEAPS